jgi:predicted transcriptional regulator
MKHNYLNNKDILKEIHKSKNTYCWYDTPASADYDIIVTANAKGTISKKDVLQGRKNRAERLAKLAHEAATADGTKRKLEEFEIKHTKIPVEEVVFRVMTWAHIPVDDAKTLKAQLAEEENPTETEYDEDGAELTKSQTKYVKVNFPPFQHWKITLDADEEHTYTVIGISHWRGDPATGSYSRDHGMMTNKLALMFMKLCERYATRSNWRGYTYNDEMRSQALLQLSQIGLQFDESKSQNPFAYYTAAITNSFTRVLNIEKRNQNLRDDILEMNNLNPSYTRQNQNSGGSWGSGGAADE